MAPESPPVVPCIGRIPVRNIWWLMLYASDMCRFLEPGKAGLESNPDDLPDLVAEILTDSVEKRARKNLSLGYCPKEEVLNRVRGRIDALQTACHNLLARGQVACTYDRLTHDTPRNRFVRAALDHLSRLAGQASLRQHCRNLARRMAAIGVSGQVPSRREILCDQFGRHDADDRIMVAAAKLAFDLALPVEMAGNTHLHLPDREEVWVRRLFERAVGGFYQVTLKPKGWQVHCGQAQTWQVQMLTPGMDRILPNMRTDIVLDHPQTGRRIVVDTKFTAILTKGWYREDSLKSGYLYQMYAYLHSQVGRGDHLADRASGLLLHPAVDGAVDETVVIQDHPLRFATVDLAAPPRALRERLLALSEPGPGTMAACQPSDGP